jgi:hypothetical protein
MSDTTRPLLRVVSPEDMQAADARSAQAAIPQPQALTGLAAYIRGKYGDFQRHRAGGSGWDDRLLHAMRTFKGEYDPGRRAEIAKFGGSNIYARLTSVKCRGATALLRDVYLNSDRAWSINATPDPVLPEDIRAKASQLVMAEAQTMQQAGQPVSPEQMRDRLKGIMENARQATKKQAKKAAEQAGDKLDDMLVEGGFYKAFAEFLVDLPLFPFACIKGPMVRIVPDLVWQDGKPVVKNKAKLFWERVSPFDIWFTPGVNDIEDAEILERRRLTRSDLNDLIGLPGYDEAAIREILQLHGQGGLNGGWTDGTENERAVQESRENPTWNTSGLIDCMEFHGPVQGKLLLDHGFTSEQVPDPDLDLYVQAWVIGRWVIKVQFSPSPRKRHPYFMTSFEKVPGTVVGNALPDLLADIQDACNASLRSLVNNMSIASGPQVVINMDRVHDTAEVDDLYPWKRWYMTTDPMGSTADPVKFFHPQMYAQELMGIYEKFSQMADEMSAIPRYVTGSERTGGAGRTASGLAMLMGNASKILQTVAANIDRDVMDPALSMLYDMVMLTDTEGVLRGDESIEVMGVAVVIQRETQRQRQMEFLQVTANPIDMQIMGPEGRAAVLRAVSQNLGLDGETVVPDDETLKQRMMAAQQQALQQGGLEGQQGSQPALSGNAGPSTNVVSNAAPGPQTPQGGQ